MIKILLAVIFSILPLYVVRLSFLGIPTTLLEVAIFLTFGLWLVSKVYNKESIREIINFRFFWFGVFFIIIGLFETYISSDRRGGLGILKAYFFDPFLVYIMLTDTLRKGGSPFWVIGSITVGGLFLSLLAFFQYVTSWNPFAPHEVALGRVTGVYNTGNALGLFLGPLVALYVERFIDCMHSGRKLKAVAYFCVTIIWLFTIFLSKSRGALIALLGVLLLYLAIVVLEKKFRPKRILLLTFISTFVFLILSSVLIFRAYSDIYSSKISYHGSDTLRIRLFIWSGSFRLLSDKPIIGAGLNGFKPLYENVYVPKQFTEVVQYPHNLFLTFWAELGLPGLLLFIGFMFYLVKVVFRRPSGRSGLWFLGWGIFAAFYYYFLHGLVDVPYFKNDLSVLMWILVSLAESRNPKR